MVRHRPPARIPSFLAVPVRARANGWTPLRQAEFVGFLAETGSVRAAARMVGMTREGAYRLRARAGAEGFASAWDVALGLGDTGPAVSNIAPRKVTHDELARRAFEGVWRVVVRDGRYRGVVLSPDNTALLRVIARIGRAAVDETRLGYATAVPGRRTVRRASTDASAQPSLISPSSSPSQ